MTFNPGLEILFPLVGYANVISKSVLFELFKPIACTYHLLEDPDLRKTIYVRVPMQAIKIDYLYYDIVYVDENAVIKFIVPDQYSDIYYNIINGRYSKLDSNYKHYLTLEEKVIKNDGFNMIFTALHPTDSKRKIISKELNVDIKYIKETCSLIPWKEYL